jgi:hypothetical protein
MVRVTAQEWIAKFNFQLPLSGSHLPSKPSTHRPKRQHFQLPLSGSPGEGDHGHQEAEDFQLPLSGSPDSEACLSTLLYITFNSLSRDHREGPAPSNAPRSRCRSPFNSLSRDHPHLRDASSTLGHLSTPSLGITSRGSGRSSTLRWTFNSLSRDHILP